MCYARSRGRHPGVHAPRAPRRQLPTCRPLANPAGRQRVFASYQVVPYCHGLPIEAILLAVRLPLRLDHRPREITPWGYSYVGILPRLHEEHNHTGWSEAAGHTASRIRTCNPGIRSPALYPLSYGRSRSQSTLTSYGLFRSCLS